MTSPWEEPELPDDNGMRIQRLVRLLATLESGSGWNVTKLARRFGVTRRTIFRDVSLMREAGFTVDFDDDRDAYNFIAAEGVRFFSGLTEEDWLVMAWLLEFSAGGLSGELADRSNQLKEKLWRSLPPDRAGRLRERLRLADERRVERGSRAAGTGVLWGQLTRAVERRTALRLMVREGDVLSTMVATPQRLMLSPNGWTVELTAVAAKEQATITCPITAIVSAGPALPATEDSP